MFRIARALQRNAVRHKVSNALRVCYQSSGKSNYLRLLDMRQAGSSTSLHSRHLSTQTESKVTDQEDFGLIYDAEVDLKSSEWDGPGPVDSTQRAAQRAAKLRRPPAKNMSNSNSNSNIEDGAPSTLSDAELYDQIDAGRVKFFNLENDLGDNDRAVAVRRQYIERKTGNDISALPSTRTDFSALYEQIKGQNCENVIGMVPIPVGVAGPLVVNGEEYYIPMATTEGALIASTTRGCKAISMSGGLTARITRNGMSRAPVLQVPDIKTGYAIQNFCKERFEDIAECFATTSRFARLQDLKVHIAGRKVFIRFTSSTGDAMGMNMVGKGVEKALSVIVEHFPEVQVLALSGNMCTDKKPSAMNWIEGRGKSVVADAVIRGDVVEKVLKTTVKGVVEANYAKNLLGSALAGSIGGNNAHASNVVTAIFLATGQDPAQNVESSNCLTTMEAVNDGQDLYISVNMPSIEVGTVGGGTSMPGQGAMLSLLGVKGSDMDHPGRNAEILATQVAGGVMAGELSLLCALSSGHLISSHMKLNRKSTPDTK